MNSKKKKFIDMMNQKLESHIFQFDTNNIPTSLPFEACMIEFSRKLPHIEYLLRNAIDKLPNEIFSFSIACTMENYDFMKEITNKIDFPITVYVLPSEIRVQSVNEYNEMLYTSLFWELFKDKEKILLLQEDTFIFKKNIKDFFHFDYIGAPWAYSVVRNYNVRVGNGGFSFRSMKLIFEALEKKEIILEKLKSNAKPFFYNRNLTSFPEDVFFSFAAVFLENYTLPSVDDAKSFSTENIVSKHSLGGHQFWNMDRTWMNRL